MKSFIFMWIFVASVFLVHADTFDDDGVLTMEEFLLVNDSTLLNFDDNLTSTLTELGTTTYTFEMNVYEMFYDYIDDDDDEWTQPIAIKKMIPIRMEFNWYCGNECDYDSFLLEFKDWWFDYYAGIKLDYE